MNLGSSQLDIPPEIPLAPEIDAIERRGGEQSLEASRLAGAEAFTQQGAGLCSAFGIAERFDDAPDKCRIILADVHFHTNDPPSFQPAAIGR